jgi:hypothetical protein
MHHIIYKTTCIATGKYYIGMHSSKKEVDCYLGSGNILRASIKKHGRSAHTRETIATASSREELRLLEERLVTSSLLDDPLCMNLAVGGCGSGVGRIITEKTRKIWSTNRQGWAHMDPLVRERARRQLSKRQSERRGALNHASLSWTLLSPDNKVHTTKALSDFCLQHGLAYTAFRNKRSSANTSPILKGPSKGWSLLSVS